MACCFKWCLHTGKSREKLPVAADDEPDDEPDRDCELPPVRHITADCPAYRHLHTFAQLQRPPDGPLQEVLQLSDDFPVPWPLEEVRCARLLQWQPAESLERHANSAYPLLHEGALYLYMDFLEHKLRHGSAVERALYRDMSVGDLVQRFLDRRAVSFAGADDSYMLLGGERGRGGWELVGTDEESPPLVLRNCLAYDEVKLSALLCVSSESVFVNEGVRNNLGQPPLDPGSVQPCGVVVGVTRARVDRPGLLDWQDAVLAEDGGASPTPWRQLWSGFYGAAAQAGRCAELPSGRLVDCLVLGKRVGVSAETLLLEAQHRAAAAKTKAHVYVGARLAPPQQEKAFLDAFADCLRRLAPVLSHVSDVHFAWFREKTCGGVASGGVIGKKVADDGEEDEDAGIRVHFSLRAPHERLDAGRLLVVSYPVDGNALPGNEFWLGKLGSSSQACSSQVAELHNPHVNRRKVSGCNLHVACARWGVLHVAEYARRKLQSLH